MMTETRKCRQCRGTGKEALPLLERDVLDTVRRIAQYKRPMPATASAIRARLQHYKDMHPTGIYRPLRSLVAAGQLRKVESGLGRAAVYEVADE